MRTSWIAIKIYLDRVPLEVNVRPYGHMWSFLAVEAHFVRFFQVRIICGCDMSCGCDMYVADSVVSSRFGIQTFIGTFRETADAPPPSGPTAMAYVLYAISVIFAEREDQN